MSDQNWPLWMPLRDDLKNLSPYGAPQVPAQAILNTNENPYAPSPELAKAIADRVHIVATNLNRYPDRDAEVLRAVLAKFINSLSGTSFGVDNIWAANGSNEIIQSLFMAFGDRPALGFTPSYSVHPLIAKVIGTQWIDGERRADFSLDIAKAKSDIAASKPALTFVTTPNNPTGTTVTLAEIEELLQATSAVNGLLVVDEAYAEFSDLPSAVTLLSEHSNLVVIRTMSKAFAFAGARLGYLVSNKELVSAMFLVRLPYHLSSLTQAAAEVALQYQGELLGNVSTLIEARKSVVNELEKLGLQVVPSQANFVIFSGFAMPPAQLWRQLLDRGVLIRDVGLLAHLRVTIGNEAENEKFIQALQDALIGENQ
jgi:histidinol-phosphate aminotransferase